jgi:hypothetical protein
MNDDRTLIETLFSGTAEFAVGAFSRITRDGRWLLNSGGSDGSFALPYPPVNARPIRLDRALPTAPFLDPPGRYVYGFNPALDALTVQPLLERPGSAPQVTEPTFLFPLITTSRVGANIGSVSRDGSRILAIATDNADELGPQVLTDWTILLPK